MPGAGSALELGWPLAGLTLSWGAQQRGQRVIRRPGHRQVFHSVVTCLRAIKTDTKLASQLGF